MHVNLVPEEIFVFLRTPMIVIGIVRLESVTSHMPIFFTAKVVDVFLDRADSDFAVFFSQLRI